MKILEAENIRMADAATVAEEGITGYDLMERAARALCSAVLDTAQDCKVLVFCGKGNNGGDGYALTRMLSDNGLEVGVVNLFPAGRMTAECRRNMEILPAAVRKFNFDTLTPDKSNFDTKEIESFISGQKQVLIVDAMLGTGVCGLPKEPIASAINFINSLRRPDSTSKNVKHDQNPASNNTAQEQNPSKNPIQTKTAQVPKILSIDLPSGLPAEPFQATEGQLLAVKADETLTIEFPKLSLLFPTTGKYSGRLRTIPIGLSQNFIKSCPSNYRYIDKALIDSIIPKRNNFAHKGQFGHALIIAGSHGMMGAAILATAAALKSGCGLVTAHIPENERLAIHIATPSAMVSTDSSPYFSQLPDNISRYTAIGIGPGIGKAPETAQALRQTLLSGLPLVIDADALNIISAHSDLLQLIPENSILTPHIGELKRLLQTFCALKGNTNRSHDTNENVWDTEGEKLKLVTGLAAALKSVIVVKGAHTMICSPSGRLTFNSTGCPGMAKGGSGDVLTGLMTGLRSKGMGSEEAAIAAVYFHGLAGDRAAAIHGEESMNASDILSSLKID